MSVSFTLRNIDTATDPTQPRSLARTLSRLGVCLERHTAAPHRLEYEGDIYRERTTWETLRRVNRLLRLTDGPDRIIVHSCKGPGYAVRKHVVRVPPAPDGPGTRPIDLIHAAVGAECARRGWDVRDMGICVDKPGEHGACNAYDFGCTHQDGKLLPADEIHRRITAMGRWLMYEGLAHDASRGQHGLPVNGAIWLRSYFESGNDGPRPYTGTAHVSHVHVSGKPSVTGWV